MLTIQWFTERIGRRTSEVSPCAYGRWLDGVLVSAEAGHLVIDYVVRPEMTNPAGILHGGVVAGMIDDVFGMLAATLVEERFLVTIDLHVDYLASAREGDVVTVDARVVRGGASVMHAEASLLLGEKLLARSSTNMVVGRIAVSDRR
jgi:acyl-coenzyme A thioesterase 13